MAKEQLTGTLDEQCEFLYRLAHTKMGEGNFTGAAYALKEIVRHQPGYKDAAQLLGEAKRRQAEQRFLLLFSFAGAIVATGLVSAAGVPNDLWLLAGAAVGLLAGYGFANLVNSFRRR